MTPISPKRPFVHQFLTKNFTLLLNAYGYPFRVAEMRMYRVLVATLLAAVTVMVTGCTGSLRLGSSIPVVEAARTTANV